MSNYISTNTSLPISNNNKNSLYNKYSRYVTSGVSETANNFIEWWERTIFTRDPSDIVYTIENFYSGRMDLIATAFYNEPRYASFLCQYNNIIDPLTEIIPGRIILIPSQARISSMISSRQGGIQSTKMKIPNIITMVD